MGLLVRAVVSGKLRGPGAMVGMAENALRSAVEQAAAAIQEKGRANITGAGNFGSRWTEGFEAKVSSSNGEVTLKVTEAVPYWTVFQFGKVIQGKPLLFFAPNKAPAGLAVGAALPKVISKHSVTIPKKFNLIEIAKEEAARVPLLFKASLGEANKKS